jgi:hypothetical protein
MEQTSIVEGPHEAGPDTERRRQYERWYSAITREEMPGYQTEEYREQSQPAAVGVPGECTDNVWIHKFMRSLTHRSDTLSHQESSSEGDKNASQRNLAGRGIKRRRRVLRQKTRKQESFPGIYRVPPKLLNLESNSYFPIVSKV